ncbi:phage holin family protein [Ruminococcus sp. Marseille-P6503]|uniref:phage holin family protein n=1 Tax=Ruminococcus sp. Marseille-P6503 TaxID=2364796 RepID=UPI00325C2E14
MDSVRHRVMAAAGLAGSAIAELFGGWTSAMTTLIIFMAIDYITGIIVAGVFKKSLKSQSGALESKAGFKGLCRKGTALLILLVSCRLDRLMGTEYLKNAVCIAFIVNETLSITENAGLMGIPVPSPLKKAIDILRNKEK